MPERYVDYGTEPFIGINWARVRYVRWLSDQYRHVVYADLDVGWLADPLWYLNAIAKVFPLAFQTEALRRFPPVCCVGDSCPRGRRRSRFSYSTPCCRITTPASRGAACRRTEYVDAMITRTQACSSTCICCLKDCSSTAFGYRNLLDRPAAVLRRCSADWSHSYFTPTGRSGLRTSEN